MSRNDWGTSMFETAVVMLVALSMLLGAVGVSDVVMTSYRVGRAADLIAYDHTLKPLILREDGGIALNETGLRVKLQSLADEAEAAVQGLVAGSAADYRIELELGIVELNARTGQVERTSTRQALAQSRGGFLVPARVREETRLDREFERIAGRVGDTSPYAISVPGSVGMEDQYLPVTVLLGVRVVVSLEGSPTAHALGRLGLLNDNIVYDWKAVPLRGEMETSS